MSLSSLTGEADFHLCGFNSNGTHTEKEGISVASLLEELASSLNSNTLGQLEKDHNGSTPDNLGSQDLLGGLFGGR